MDAAESAVQTRAQWQLAATSTNYHGRRSVGVDLAARKPLLVDLEAGSTTRRALHATQVQRKTAAAPDTVRVNGTTWRGPRSK
ncbi:hypothetical protein ON010_g2317 [Phytophthora cinnamomi]|nr:hypothetical protein ON010_g2317 [Phytophthora cinnamomi]